MKILLVVMALLLTTGTAKDFPEPIVTYRYPKFGKPVVAKEHLVFCGPKLGLDGANRLVCIARRDGKKVWDLEDDEQLLSPWLAMDDVVVITKGTDILSCRLKDKKTRLLYAPGFDECRSIIPCGLPRVLLSGKKDEKGYLSLVDLKDGVKQWEIEAFNHVIAEGREVLLCARHPWDFYKWESGALVKQHRLILTGVSKKDGAILWQYPAPEELTSAEGVAIGAYFVVKLGKKLIALDQNRGTIAANVPWRIEGVITGCLCAHGDSVLLWSSNFNVQSASAFTVPELVKTTLMKPDHYAARACVYKDTLIGTTVYQANAYSLSSGERRWKGSQWEWEGVHDGLIYFSEMETDGKYTSVQSIEVDSGKRRVLYRELLPEKMQWDNLHKVPKDLQDKPVEYAFSWSPDGKQIAFLSKTMNPSSEKENIKEGLCVMNSDRTGLRYLKNNTESSAAYHATSWSCDGKKIAFLWLDGEPAPGAESESLSESNSVMLHTINVDGSNMKCILRNYNMDPSYVVWSPVKRKILCAYQAEFGGKVCFYIFNDDGSEASKILEYKTGSILSEYPIPAWSPDGKQIAFIKAEKDKGKLCTVNDDGSGLKEITGMKLLRDYPDRPLDWSPDGKKIVFSKVVSKKGVLCIVNADGSGLQQITSAKHSCWQPDWSPDGKKIAFVKWGEMSSIICTISPDGSGHREITGRDSYCAFPAWSPDGKKMAFTRDKAGESKICVLNME